MKEWKALNRMKKSELIESIKLLEKDNHKLVDDYNTLLHLTNEENEKIFNSLCHFVTEITKVTKYKYKNNETINIPKLIKHVKKSCKRW